MQKKVTELEFIVLGSIETYGPCTPYRIREIFRGSLSNHWKCSSGSIYPIIRRLVEMKLVTKSRSATGKRSHGLLSISSSGKKYFRKWLVSENVEAGDLVNFDPLRARVRFSSLLSKAERESFFRNIREALKKHVSVVKKYLNEMEKNQEVDQLQLLVIKAGLRDMKSQLRWLSETKKLLDSQ